MTKAIRMMEDNLRLVDALIYVIDARAVYSCDNPLFNKLLQGKRVLYVFNKCDLVEKNDLDLWCKEFERQGKPYVKAIGTSGDCSQIVAGLKKVVADKIDKYAQKGEGGDGRQTRRDARQTMAFHRQRGLFGYARYSMGKV